MATSKPTISTSFLYETLEETLDIKPQGAKLHIGIPKETAFQETELPFRQKPLVFWFLMVTKFLLNI